MSRGLRIVGGSSGGRRLRAPRGSETRPTADRVREAMFALIGPAEGLDALDLFAGSGALGLEALSRGAASAVLVDRSPRALAAARRNVDELGLGDRVILRRADWRAALRRLRQDETRFGLCLLDPPYTLLPRIAGALSEALAPVLASGATVAVEHAAGADGSLPGLPVATSDRRVYGDTAVTILRLEH